MKVFFERRGRSVAAILLIAVGTALTLWACKGSGSLRIECTTPLGGGSVETEWDTNQGGRITSSPGNANCDVRFTGPGGTTGTAQNVPVGQTIPIPAGTTGAVITGIHPRSGPGGDGGGGMADILREELAADIGQTGGHGRRGSQAVPFEYFIVVMPLDAAIDLGPSWGALSNVYGDFRYRSTSILTADDLYNLVSPYVLTDIGNQPALVPGLDVRLLARCVPNANGRGGRLYVADVTRRIESFEFLMNGVELATLDHDCFLHDAPNGWKVVETEIEFSDFNIYPGGSSNTFRLTLETDESGEVGLASTLEYY
jgi:hypothetical protein